MTGNYFTYLIKNKFKLIIFAVYLCVISIGFYITNNLASANEYYFIKIKDLYYQNRKNLLEIQNHFLIDTTLKSIYKFNFFSKENDYIINYAGIKYYLKSLYGNEFRNFILIDITDPDNYKPVDSVIINKVKNEYIEILKRMDELNIYNVEIDKRANINYDFYSSFGLMYVPNGDVSEIREYYKILDKIENNWYFFRLKQ